MALLISYDIEENYLRQKIANYILDAGFERIQYSVYMGTVKDSITNQVKDWLNALPKNKDWKSKDSIIILSITGQQVQDMISIGNPQWDKDDLSGDRHTMMF